MMSEPLRSHGAEVAQPDFLERHYTLLELAEAWQTSERTIRRWFRDEPGIVAFNQKPTASGKRRYTLVRVPESVARRVYQRNLSQNTPA